MEFERAIFRMHEQLLRSPSSKRVLNWTVAVLAFITTLLFTNFSAYHLSFVNHSLILRSALESQQMTPG